MAYSRITTTSSSGVAVITQHEDICNAWLEFYTPRGRCVANISASRLALKTERVTRITGENGYIKIDYATKAGTIIRRRANELQMEEIREQLRGGADLTRWQEQDGRPQHRDGRCGENEHAIVLVHGLA